MTVTAVARWVRATLVGPTLDRFASGHTVDGMDVLPLAAPVAEARCGEIARLLSSIPQITFTSADVLAGSKRGVPLTSRWEHSLYCADGAGHVRGVLLTYERPPEPATLATLGHRVYPAASFYLDALAVDGPWRGRGLGTSLIRSWLDRTAVAGLTIAEAQPCAWSLQTNAASWNAETADLYRRFGFSVVGHKQYADRTDLVMWRRASPRGG